MGPGLVGFEVAEDNETTKCKHKWLTLASLYNEFMQVTTLQLQSCVDNCIIWNSSVYM